MDREREQQAMAMRKTRKIASVFRVSSYKWNGDVGELAICEHFEVDVVSSAEYTTFLLVVPNQSD